MDIPRGHAAMPLTEADFLDFVYNYFKAEYAPIRSFWSTATADPRQPARWISMGHEMSPLAFRPANAQAQKDLESLDYFTRKWNLDGSFVRGLVIRFAKYELHDRLEKRLFECARLDLMVRKALKEKHLLDALWPSPAPRTLSHDLLAQGVQVRKWYGDMFTKYFRVLHSIDEFELRPEVDQRIKSSGTLMLVPLVDHLIFGAVDPIMPIVARGTGYSNAKGWRASSGSSKSDGYGEPGQFEIRFDAPADVQDTYTKTVVRQCRCNQCGTKKDVRVVVSIDPTPAGGAGVGTSAPRKQSGSKAPDQRRNASMTAQRYAPGYDMPGGQSNAPHKPPRRPEPQPQPEEPARPYTPDQKKQCARCTFLNHAELTACEMCQADLPETTIAKPPSPVAPRTLHAHSASNPPPSRPTNKSVDLERRPPPNRHSFSSTLFSIFPFSQQIQQEHHAKLPPTQQTDTTSVPRSPTREEPKREPIASASVPATTTTTAAPSPPSPIIDNHPSSSSPTHTHAPPLENEPPLPRAPAPQMAMMPLTPPPTTWTASKRRAAPAGLPSHLMDDFVVPVSLPAFGPEAEEGWGEEMESEEAGREGGGDGDGDEDEDEKYEGRSRSSGGGMVDLDEVAREEADVWGERED
ncbi:hypothetical protein ACEQ8H_002939 [Pleosporales sp. CAS-2024a]